MSIEGISKYLCAVIKCNNNDDESIKIVEKKLKELINAELDFCIEIVNAKEKFWGETAIRVNLIAKDIEKQIAAKKIP